jgi:hypothetical protein
MNDSYTKRKGEVENSSVVSQKLLGGTVDNNQWKKGTVATRVVDECIPAKQGVVRR